MLKEYEETSPQPTGTNLYRLASNKVNHSKDKQVMQQEYTMNDKMRNEHQNLANRELERVMFIKRKSSIFWHLLAIWHLSKKRGKNSEKNGKNMTVALTKRQYILMKNLKIN